VSGAQRAHHPQRGDRQRFVPGLDKALAAGGPRPRRYRAVDATLAGEAKRWARSM